ncbi:hypothetical protein WSM22_31480 [Cytophagales bacterium WSM2-2]|nr:hypothetical protein WSM22_31480 [Cytophagales bacterium WSM2-2]
MGVTIHFEGKLKSQKDFDEVIEKAIDFAKRKSSDIIKLNNDKKLLKRVKDEKDWDYEGEVKGVQIQPHDNSDPLILEFDKDLFIQEFCKTQFSDISTHIDIIKFLRDIESNFDNLSVIDEGEFWETNDIKLLEQKFEDFFVAFDNAIQENPKLKGPFKMSDGRIVDLME